MELWDVYDSQRQKTGQTIERGKILSNGALHIVVHVCVFNSEHKMLIQQRQPFKSGWSNMWDVTVGGSALAGETSNEAAARELFEEVGISYNFSECRPYLTINFKYGFDDYYILEAEPNIANLQLQYEEVRQVKWASKNEILELIETGAFIPYHKSLIELLFASRDKYGSHVFEEK